MKNCEGINFSYFSLNAMNEKGIGIYILRMSCEELLTCRILSDRQMVCLRIQRELMSRLEEGDMVEVVSGFEKVRQVCGTYAYITGRDFCRYGARTIGFYNSTHESELVHTYRQQLKNVDWTATKIYPKAPWIEQRTYDVVLTIKGVTTRFTFTE